MKQARQDGTGWDDRGPFRPFAPQGAGRSEAAGRYDADVLGSNKIVERFSVRHGISNNPNGRPSMAVTVRKATAGEPKRPLRQRVDMAPASDIADPLREARIKQRAHELIDAGVPGHEAKRRARWEVA